MIYTVGHKANYLEAMERNAPEPITKTGMHAKSGHPDYYPGGIAFQTPEEAHAYLVKIGREQVWAVFSLDCTWENTYPDPTGKYGYLLIKDTSIIGLVEIEGDK